MPLVFDQLDDSWPWYPQLPGWPRSSWYLPPSSAAPPPVSAAECSQTYLQQHSSLKLTLLATSVCLLIKTSCYNNWHTVDTVMLQLVGTKSCFLPKNYGAVFSDQWSVSSEQWAVSSEQWAVVIQWPMCIQGVWACLGSFPQTPIINMAFAPPHQLHWAILHCTALGYPTLDSNRLFCNILHCAILQGIALGYPAPYCA